MIANVLSLEAAKQKHALLSIVLILGILLAAAMAQARLRHANALDMVEAVVFASVVALPAIALVLAATAAWGLRSESRRAAEEPLPFSPHGRLWGAYAVSLTMFVALAAVLLAADYKLAGGNSEGLNTMKPIFSTALLYAGILYVHLLAFAFTYWIGQPILGGGLACVCAGLTFLCLRSYQRLLDYPYFFIGWDEAFMKLVPGVVFCWAAVFAALHVLARPVERTEKLRWKALVVGLALTCAPLLSFGAVLKQVHFLETTLHPLWSYWSTLDPGDPLYLTPGEGAFFATPSGNVFRVMADGTKHVLYQAPGISPFTLSREFSVRILDLVNDRDGITWMLLQPDLQNSPSTYEIRSGRQGQPLETYSTFNTDNVAPRYWLLLQDKLSIGADDYRRGMVWVSPLPPRGKLPQWRNLPATKSGGLFASLREARLAEAAVAGRAAVFSANRTTLSLKHPGGAETKWMLPGKAAWDGSYNYSEYSAPVPFGANASLYIVPVFVEDKKERLVLCYPDGAVRDPWNRIWDAEMLTGHTIPGGSVWRVGPWQGISGELLVVDRSGNAYPPVSIRGLYHQAGLSLPDGKHTYHQMISLRIENNRFWTILQGTLVEIDLHNGIPRKLAVLADPSGWILDTVFIRPVKEGVYFVKDGRILLVDWNGAVKDLGKAEIPDAGIF